MHKPEIARRQPAGGALPESAQAACSEATDACVRGDWERARLLLDRALADHGDDGELLHLKGLAMLREGDRDGALSALRQACLQSPGAAQIHYNLGVTCAEFSRHEEAMVHYGHCLRLEPTHRDALWNFGEMLRLRERFGEAVRCFELLQSLGARNEWLDFRLAVARLGTGDIPGATQCFERELARVDPSSARELRAHPASALVHWEYAHLLLKAGAFERGFESYEHRFAAGDRTGVRCATFAVPRWQGEPLAGKALLIHGEQGLGDQIMFASLVPQLVAELGGAGRLVLAVSPSLVRLFKLAWPGAEVLAHTPDHPLTGRALEGLDFETPICSLARWRTEWLIRLRRQPAYLRADPKDRELRRARVASLAPDSGDTLKVGLLWGSNPAQWDAKASHRARQKSIALTELAPLAELDGVSFVSLQNHDVALDAANAPFDLIDCHEVLTDLAHTAALIAEMDVIVSVDTSVAHLAAAMGCAPMVLLMERADWRWGLHERACAWYPDLLVQLRQERQGDWRPVVAELTQRLDMLSRRHRRGKS